MIRHFTRRSLVTFSHKLSSSTPLSSHPLPSSSFPFHLVQRHLATFQVVVPALGDSITEGTIAELTKAKGDDVSTDEVIARLETDKVSIDVRSTGSGKIAAVNVKEGDTVHVGDVLFEGDDAGGGGGGQQAAAAASKDGASTEKASKDKDEQPKKQSLEPEATPTKTQAIDSAHTQQSTQQQQSQQQKAHGAAHTEDDTQQHHAHQPLIQFRHGRRSTQSNQPSQPHDARKQPRQVPASSLNQPGTATQQSQQQQSTLLRGLQPDSYFNQSDFTHANQAAATARQQLPVYYRRKAWNEAEQEAVMMGGAPAYVPKSLQKEKEKTAAAGGKKK